MITINTKDTFGFGKGIDKLVAVIESGVGRIFKSYFDKKDIDNEAYRVTKLAEAKVNELKMISEAIRGSDSNVVYGSGEKLEISSAAEQVNLVQTERIKERLNHQETKRQFNLEQVTATAAQLLKEETNISDESVDDDWTTRFFTIAADVSDAEMQRIWARVLAGEIKEPKTYSLKTLDILRNMTKSDAQLFSKVAKLCLQYGGVDFIINPDNFKYLLKEFGVSYGELMHLEYLGLLNNTPLTSATVEATSSTDRNDLFKLGNKGLLFKKQPNATEQVIYIVPFTQAGGELHKLVDKPFNRPYLEKLAQMLKQDRSEFFIVGHRDNANGSSELLQPFDTLSV
jgi:uncharacterized repeat protein (TIGR03899 family)